MDTDLFRRWRSYRWTVLNLHHVLLLYFVLVPHLFLSLLWITSSNVVVAQRYGMDPYEGGGPLQGGTRCYDEKGKAQRCVPEFMQVAYLRPVEVTNTCGERGPTEWCRQIKSEQDPDQEGQRVCEICDEDHPHPPSFLTDFNDISNITWWQSETLYDAPIQFPNSVNLTLRLGKSFDITYVRLRFQSVRPESMAIYKKMRSEDDSWMPFHYFSASCRDTYGVKDSMFMTPATEHLAHCTSQYSQLTPLEGGVVIFTTLDGRPGAYQYDNKPELQVNIGLLNSSNNIA